jgi:hypothetical protein
MPGTLAVIIAASHVSTVRLTFLIVLMSVSLDWTFPHPPTPGLIEHESLLSRKGPACIIEGGIAIVLSDNVFNLRIVGSPLATMLKG